jgi:adenine deaminase
VGPEEIDHLLSLPAYAVLGEVMNFNGVADGTKRFFPSSRRRAPGRHFGRTCLVLTGRRLQAFRAVGIDSDHTTACPEKTPGGAGSGLYRADTGSVLTAELVTAMNELPIQNRVCLVTDDVPLPA